MTTTQELDNQIALMQEALIAAQKERDRIALREKKAKNKHLKENTLNGTACKLLAISDIAKLFGCSEKTIRRMHNAGRLPEPFRLPGSTHWKWRERDIVRFLNELSGDM